MTKVLVIEDEGPIRERVQRILEFEGYETLGAENGLTGVGMAHQHHPDVIICDLAMPELNGFGALSVLKTHDRTETIPFVVLTASGERSSQRMAMERGADDYITKPFSAEELVAAVKAQVRKREALVRHLHGETCREERR